MGRPVIQRLTLRAQPHGNLPVVMQPQVPFTQSAFGQYREGVGTLRASGGDLGGGSETLAAVDCRNLRETNQSGILQAKSSGGYSLNYQNPVRVGYAVRRLTPTECERLQGFPDKWTEGGSDTARYRALGNSVAVPCVEWIMRRIKEAIEC
jgi:site-specific DNA-cytosine methylase